MSNEVEFNSLTKDDVKIRFEDSSGVSSKPTDEEVAKHRKTRLILVVLFAVAVVAMVVVAVIIIIVAPQCEKAEEVKEKGNGNENLKGNDTIDENWWKNAVIYQVYPLSFKDSDSDGYGDLKGIAGKMDYFTELGVNAVGLSPIYQSPMADGGYDISNYTAIGKTFGTMEEFEAFLKQAHEKGFKIIMEFVPNHSSDEHPWFEESKKAKDNNKFRDYYIWRDPTGAGKDQPPNNWISVFGGSAWSYDNTTNQYYLHQFHKKQPDLNLRNDEVKEELKKVLKFWLDKGVDGFRVNAAQFLLEDENFDDEPQNSNYNMSDPTYNMLDHTLTYDLDGNREILSEFQKVLDEYDSHPILVAEVMGSYAKTSKYYGMSDIPINYGLINKVARQGMTLSQGIEKTVEEYMASVPDGKTPNWVIGDHNNARVGSRLGEDNRYAMNTLALTLPGVALTYYGEEIGMLDGNTTNPKDKQRTPMQWNKEATAGFSTGQPWLPLASDYLTINVDTEKGDSKSYLNKYKELIKLRNNTAFVSGTLKIVHVDTQVFSYVRTHEDEHFLVVINFSNKIWDGDLAKLSGLGTVVYDTQSKLAGKEKVDVNKLKLNVGQAVIVKNGDEKWHMS